MKLKLFPSIIGFVLLTSFWQLIAMMNALNEHSIVPAPIDVGKTLAHLFIEGEIWGHIVASVFRFSGGYTSAAVVAIVLGLLLGRMEKLWSIIDPIVQVLRPVSPVAWSPFIVLWFGIGHLSNIVIIFFAAFFPVLLTTVTAVRKVDKAYLNVAENFEVPTSKTLLKVILPASFPAIANGLRMAIGSAWIFLVAGEMAGTQSGLGYLVVESKDLQSFEIVLAVIMIIGFLGFLIDKGIRSIETFVFAMWGGQFKKQAIPSVFARNAINSEQKTTS